MARRGRPRKVTYFEPVPPRLGRNIIIESTFDVGRRFRCTMRIDCGELNPGPSFGRYPANGTRACPSISTKRSLATDAPTAAVSVALLLSAAAWSNQITEPFTMGLFSDGRPLRSSWTRPLFLNSTLPKEHLTASTQ